MPLTPSQACFEVTASQSHREIPAYPCSRARSATPSRGIGRQELRGGKVLPHVDVHIALEWKADSCG
jgi:hypothetical protein